VATRPGGFHKILYDDLMQKWLNTSSMIITPKNSPRIVDFKSKLLAWQGSASKLVTDENEEGARKAFEFFAAFLSALSASGGPVGIVTRNGQRGNCRHDSDGVRGAFRSGKRSADGA
jgi:hypothetical protein